MEKSYVSTFYGICFKIVSATMLDHNPLEAVYIYFDTATYDEIEKDKKVIFEINHKTKDISEMSFVSLACRVGWSKYLSFLHLSVYFDI